MFEFQMIQHDLFKKEEELLNILKISIHLDTKRTELVKRVREYRSEEYAYTTFEDLRRQILAAMFSFIDIDKVKELIDENEAFFGVLVFCDEPTSEDIPLKQIEFDKEEEVVLSIIANTLDINFIKSRENGLSSLTPDIGALINLDDEKREKLSQLMITYKKIRKQVNMLRAEHMKNLYS